MPQMNLFLTQYFKQSHKLAFKMKTTLSLVAASLHHTIPLALLAQTCMHKRAELEAVNERIRKKELRHWQLVLYVPPLVVGAGSGEAKIAKADKNCLPKEAEIPLAVEDQSSAPIDVLLPIKYADKFSFVSSSSGKIFNVEFKRRRSYACMAKSTAPSFIKKPETARLHPWAGRTVKPRPVKFRATEKLFLFRVFTSRVQIKQLIKRQL
jgi:hypothetical protein